MCTRMKRISIKMFVWFGSISLRACQLLVVGYLIASCVVLFLICISLASVYLKSTVENSAYKAGNTLEHTVCKPWFASPCQKIVTHFPRPDRI